MLSRSKSGCHSNADNVGLERGGEQKAFRQREAHVQRPADTKDSKSGVAEEYGWGSTVEMNLD